MKTELIDIKKIKPNKDNPRIIKDDKFKKLVESISKFPEMLEIRPVVLNKKMIVIGGNQRYKAALEAGIKQIPVAIVNLSPEKEKEFIIKDNQSAGEWDHEILRKWDKELLSEWGLDVLPEPAEIDMEGFFEEQQTNNEPVPEGVKISLEYNHTEGQRVNEALAKLGGTKESAIYNLLGLK
jgi:hypothetical protein